MSLLADSRSAEQGSRTPLHQRSRSSPPASGFEDAKSLNRTVASLSDVRSAVAQDLVQKELADRGHKPAAVENHQNEFLSDLLYAHGNDICPQSITTDGLRSILRRLSDRAGVKTDHRRYEYLLPHGGYQGMGEVLVWSFGPQSLHGISMTPK